MATFSNIHDFACRYVQLFRDPLTQDCQLEVPLGRECNSLGFTLNDGHSLQETYPGIYSDQALMIRVVSKITNVQLLGSAIYLQWRNVTHWAECSLLDHRYRSWFIIALERLKLLTEPVGDEAGTFTGKPCKLQLVSDNSCYDSTTAPSAETEQHLTITADGNVWFSGFAHVPTQGNLRLLRKAAFSIGSGPAGQILNAVADYFSQGITSKTLRDTGFWNMALTNCQGITYFYDGNLCHDLVRGNRSLSSLARQHLNIDGLFMFDGGDI